MIIETRIWNQYFNQKLQTRPGMSNILCGVAGRVYSAGSFIEGVGSECLCLSQTIKLAKINKFHFSINKPTVRFSNNSKKKKNSNNWLSKTLSTITNWKSIPSLFYYHSIEIYYSYLLFKPQKTIPSLIPPRLKFQHKSHNATVQPECCGWQWLLFL